MSEGRMKAVVMHEFLAGLGVGEQNDYTERAFEYEVDGVDVVLDLVGGDGAGLEALAPLVDSEELQVVVQESFPLAQAAEAHERLEHGRARGKYVLTN